MRIPVARPDVLCAALVFNQAQAADPQKPPTLSEIFATLASDRDAGQSGSGAGVRRAPHAELSRPEHGSGFPARLVAILP
jgi:hypothetical protein